MTRSICLACGVVGGLLRGTRLHVMTAVCHPCGFGVAYCRNCGGMARARNEIKEHRRGCIAWRRYQQANARWL